MLDDSQKDMLAKSQGSDYYKSQTPIKHKTVGEAFEHPSPAQRIKRGFLGTGISTKMGRIDERQQADLDTHKEFTSKMKSIAGMPHSEGHQHMVKWFDSKVKEHHEAGNYNKARSFAQLREEFHVHMPSGS